MDFNIDVRKKQLESLDQYITSSKDKVQSILDYLGWNTKKIVDKEPEVICSVNPTHIVAQKNVDVHLKKCYVKTSGYDTDDEFLSEPVNNPFTSIHLDQAKKIEILSQARENSQRFKAAWNGQDPDPMTSDRLFTTFSRDERLVLYDYCVQNTEHPPVPSEFNIQVQDKKEEKFLTHEELLAKQRDDKRRRIKYKTVHTSRSKSYTEVIREVIDNQMEQYKDYLSNQVETSLHQSDSNPAVVDEQNSYYIETNTDTLVKENTNNPERPGSSISRHSNHSATSKNKKDYKYEKLYRHHNHDDYRRDYKEYKEYDKRHDRHDYSNKYDHSSHKENRKYREFEDDYRHSRDKREWRHRSERRQY